MKTWQALRMFLWMTVLTGLVYPMFITLIAQLTMKQKADGELILAAGKPVGALLIGQKFESDKYFWGRPSFNDYNTLPSGGSNLGPISNQLKKEIKSRQEKNLKWQSNPSEPIPSELLYASGSGLDPHISVSTAKFQIDRIINARGLDAIKTKPQLENLVDEMAQWSGFGLLGSPIVNVLMLNTALDEEFKMDNLN